MPNIRSRNRSNLTASTALAGLSPLANDLDNSLRLAVAYVDPSTLIPPTKKLRINPSRQMSAIRASIREFGFLNPILVDENNRIICGHARWLAAQDLGLARVPVICAEHLSDEQKRVYAISENRTGELGEWDMAELRLEFEALANLDVSIDLNIELSGFSTSEIDDLLMQQMREEPDEAEIEDHFDHPLVTRAGDLWILGDHKLLCASSLEAESYARLMGDDRAQMVFCDPPYNQSMKNISGKGRAKHEEFAEASGEMSSPEFTEFLTTAFGHMAKSSEDGAIHFQCMDWHHMREMLDAGEAVYSKLKNLVVWNKGSGGMGSFYRSQHELVFAWQVGSSAPINNFGLGENGRYRTNVWDYRGNNSFHRSRDAELQSHPTVKPLLLVSDAIRDCSNRGGIILDAFGGSGTTLIAAEHTGRHARLIEIEPKYCDCTIKRWQMTTGLEALLVPNGQAWSDVARDRGVILPTESYPDDDTCELEIDQAESDEQEDV